MSLAVSRELLAGVIDDVLGDPADRGSDSTWSTVAELGWPLVGSDEAEGGAGGTLADLAAIAEGLGRCAAAVPVIETAMARWAVGPRASHWGAAEIATVAMAGPETSPRTDGAGHCVTTELASVPWMSSASHLVLIADSWAGVVDLPAAGVDITAGTNVAGEPRERVQLREVAFDLLEDAPSTDVVRNRLTLLRAAATVGAAGSALRLASEHATAREQFGRPIARFQLVASALAQMSSEVALARASLEAAVDAHGADQDRTPSTAVAALAAARAATVVARSAHQVHGAIGITREHSLHHFTRRLWAWRDDPVPERSWQRRLGRRAAVLGPDGLWDLLTAPTAAP
jgi:acyl-CoA dehydrogenase